MALPENGRDSGKYPTHLDNADMSEQARHSASLEHHNPELARLLEEWRTEACREQAAGTDCTNCGSSRTCSHCGRCEGCECWWDLETPCPAKGGASVDTRWPFYDGETCSHCNSTLRCPGCSQCAQCTCVVGGRGCGAWEV